MPANYRGKRRRANSKAGFAGWLRDVFAFRLAAPALATQRGATPMNNDPSFAPATAPKNNGLAVTSLVLGILSVAVCGVGIIFSIPGVITGILGLKRVKASHGSQKGHGLAVAGIVLSAVSLVMLPIVGLLAAIAVPNFVKARESAQRSACMANMRSINDAKAQWTLENNKAAGDTVEAADIFGSAKYVRQAPTCPAQGTYIVNPIGTNPECTVHGSLP
jgi:competence protein ComGC